MMAAAVLAASIAGCGAGSETPAAKAAKPGATANAGAADPCGEYAQRLCTELGTRTESCRAVLGVVGFMSPRACTAGLADFDSTLARIAELRKVCDSVADKVCQALGAESEGCQAIRQNLPDIPPGHCPALQRDQAQLLAALRQREALGQPLSDERWQALTAGEPAGFGAKDAPVVVVEFSDFQCPYCAQAAETVKRLRQEYGARIRFVFRNFPLPFHPNAQGAAQAAMAALRQGKFWEFHDLLFGNQNALGPDELLGYARSLGLDLDAFRAASADATIAKQVADDVGLGESVQVQGTPTMFIDKQRIDDPTDYAAVTRVLDRELAR